MHNLDAQDLAWQSWYVLADFDLPDTGFVFVLATYEQYYGCHKHERSQSQYSSFPPLPSHPSVLRLQDSPTLFLILVLCTIRVFSIGFCL